MEGKREELIWREGYERETRARESEVSISRRGIYWSKKSIKL